MTTDDPTFHAAGAAPGPEQFPDAAAPIARPLGARSAAVPVETVPLETPYPAPARPAAVDAPAAETRRTGGFTPLRPAPPSYPSSAPSSAPSGAPSRAPDRGPGMDRPTGERAGGRTGGHPDGAHAEALPPMPALPPGHAAGPLDLGGADTAYARPPGMAVTPGGIVSRGDEVTAPGRDPRPDAPWSTGGTGRRPEERPGGTGAADGITRPVGRDAPARPDPDGGAEDAGGDGPADRPAADAALVEAVLGETSGTEAEDPEGAAGAEGEDSDERMRTLIWTAATYRPLEEVVALVTQLKEARAVDSPADEALRAAAVARPLEEVRQLVAMLNEAGHTLDENDTTLRAAAVGRPIEDVVQLVAILGTAQGRPLAPGAAGTTAGGQPVPQDPCLRPPRSATATASATGARTADGPGGGANGGANGAAQRSALRWFAAAALFACGVIHLPTNFGALWSGGYADGLALAVALLCLVLGEWLIVRETARVWASAAVLSIGVVALHGMAGSSGVALLGNSLGNGWAWAGAAAVASAMLTALFAGLALLRRHRRPAVGTGI
ncbi:hypothetical protein [Streptomyces rubrolavendulae]|uniref:Uncharacterized protein n=1 Tax=Streptomyces rubrolavendulae TaxID=285473 RepID=A0A1D8FXX7_9ACTN|nr:hypothetical protein [Streptomyces rubrolavendulae]AOT58059.1 hypothetical protein A4G23_00862 [Streptomyces rubrolavendulae]